MKAERWCMVSFKTHLFGSGDREWEDTYRHIIELMLQGLAVHAVQGEQADYERFCEDMKGFAANLATDADPAQLLVTSGQVLRTLGEYNRATTEYIRRQNAELHHIVSMLTQTVIRVGANSETSADRLREIEKSLDQARVLKDIQLFKLRLGECLETVREEAERQKTASQNTISAVEEELQSSGQRVGSTTARENDPVTGLLGKEEAEKAIQTAAAAPEGKFVVVAVVNRVNAVNARFGYAIGDRVLATCARRFREGLSAVDELYRWKGPAFLAVVSRPGRIDEVRSEIQRFADARLEDTIEIGNRTVLIPISSNWSVIAATSPADVLMKRVEAFTAAQMPRDYA